jgi:hypothetical protein
MCRSKNKHGTGRAVPLIVATAATIGLGIWLGGCTQSQADLYLDRREGVSLSAGDAIAANQATQVVDPWPAYSGDRNLAFNGQRMQSAVERYRTGKVTQPVDPMNLESTNEGGSGQSNQTVVNTGGSSSGSSASASASSGSGQ